MSILKASIFKIKIVLCLLVLLVGCSSVPLSTAFKMATLDKKAISQIIPSQVRARITLDSPAELQTKDVQLVLKFEYQGQTPSEHQFLLALIEHKKLAEKKSWFGSKPLQHQYTFKIHPNSIAQFRQYQREFFKYGRPDKYHWTVYYYLANKPSKSQPIYIDLELKLFSQENYFYLLERAEVELF